MSELLPRLIRMLSGDESGIDGKKLNLIRALEPYLSKKRGESIERAIRMANAAKAAKETLGLLGR